MSIPTAVFVDTSVFEGQGFNLSSAAFSTFIPACTHRALKLLMPDPTEREIKRHMVARSHKALALMEEARRTAPFLPKSTGFPWDDENNTGVRAVLRAPRMLALMSRGEWWSSLTKQFDVVKLNYDGVSIPRVMDWYDAVEAPFGKGDKRKEFPDALAVAIVSHYAEQHQCYVAVVAHDPDLKNACARFPSLMYFHSLPVLTELLLSAEDSEIIASLKTAVGTSREQVAAAAYEQALDLSFYHSNDYSEIEQSEVTNLRVVDMRIVALGEHECTIAFDAVIDVNHRVVWYEPVPEGQYERRGESVARDHEVSGTAKISLDAKTGALLAIPFVALNEEEIETADLPPHWDRFQ